MRVTRALRFMLLAAILLCGVAGLHLADYPGAVSPFPGRAESAPVITTVAQWDSSADGAVQASRSGEPHVPAGESCGVPTRLITHLAGWLLNLATALRLRGLDGAGANAEAAGRGHGTPAPQLGLRLAGISVWRR